jgi:hypothetical protein
MVSAFLTDFWAYLCFNHFFERLVSPPQIKRNKLEISAPQAIFVMLSVLTRQNLSVEPALQRFAMPRAPHLACADLAAQPSA